MVKVHYIRKRFAFTLIELIFAIVIIGISVLSLPMMIQVTSKGVESNIIQEAIYASSTLLMSATGGYWDERSMEDMSVSHISRVIDISSSCDDTTKLKPGHINQPFHRRCLESNSFANLENATNDGLIDALEDEVESTNLFTTSTDGSSGYKDFTDKYQSNLTIVRNNDIKTITVTVSNSTGTITVLRIQSANIGEIDYYKKRM